MDKEGHRRREDYRKAVEYLCANLAELTDLAAAQPGPAWPAAVAALLAEEPFSEAWYASVRTLHEAAEELGLMGGLGLTHTMAPPGADSIRPSGWPGPAGLAGWACPGKSCSRIELDAAPAPTCHLRGEPMRQVRV